MKNNIKWILIFVIFCVACLAIFFSIKETTLSYGIAKVAQKGEIIQIINLSDIKEPYEFAVKCKSGGTNTIRVENGRIAIVDADCPDEVCVKQGFISGGTLPIVCLPHKLTISVTGQRGAYDAIVGGH